MILYKLVLPRADNKGQFWDRKHIEDWVASVCKLAGGITITERSNDVGFFLNEEGEIVKDVVRYALIGTFPHVMRQVAEVTKEHFNQSAVFYYVESKEAHLHV